MLHATAAPLQYRPLSGTNRTDGVRAVSVLTETIAELALDAPQISNAETYSLTTLIHIEKESYLNETRAGLDLPLWSSKHAAMIPLTDLRTLHAEDASILRSTRSPNLCVDVANSMFKFSAGDHQESFHTPLYKKATISAEQQEQHFSEYEPLLEVRARAMAAGKAPFYRGPLHEEFETVLAATAGRQHRTITGNPTNASLADPQALRTLGIQVSDIVKVQGGQQASWEQLKHDFIQRCSMQMPDSTFIVRPNSLQMENLGKLQTYTFILDVQRDQLPEFLETFDVIGSWISAYSVPKPKTDQLMVGAPTVRVVQPPYDERDRDFQVVARVSVLHEGPGLSSSDLQAFATACHKAWSKQVFREGLEMGVQAGRHHPLACTPQMATKCRAHACIVPTCTQYMLVKCRTLHGTHNNWCQTACKPWVRNEINLAYSNMHIQSSCLLLVLNAGMAPPGALLQALNQPLLHNMELHHITHANTTGHVRLFFFSKAAAQKVRQADYVTLGVIGGHQMKLTPKIDIHPAEKQTWRNAIVSSNLPGSEFAKPSMVFRHFQLLTTTASVMGTGMGNNSRLKTGQPKLYFYNKTGQVLDPSQVSVENVLSLFFAPMGTSFEEMSEAELTDRAGSKGGLKCCLLPADPLTASLCLAVCWQRQLENSVGSDTLLYGTHGLSSVGRSPPLPQQRPPNRGRGRAVGGMGRMANTAPSLKPSKFTAVAATILMAEQKLMPEAQFTSLVKEAQTKDGWPRAIQRVMLNPKP